jgi:hypothetical protein
VTLVVLQSLGQNAFDAARDVAPGTGRLEIPPTIATNQKELHMS